jgi:radical SAM superfamily enzyme YgiQ (UPF0313 family)
MNGKKMKVSLISVYEGITCYGLRCLSAVLKEGGFETQMIFLPRRSEGLDWAGHRHLYPEPILDQLAGLVADSGLIGITVMTNYFENAVQITHYLRERTRTPIVWGGIHPTVRPEESLEHADIVCVGEGEEALIELAQHIAEGRGYAGIDNMWVKGNGETMRTPLRPLQIDLDVYPYPDYGLENAFVLHQEQIRPLTADLLIQYLSWYYGSSIPTVPTYTTMMSRGCTFRCAYCNNNALRQIYPGQWCVRRRSVPNFIGELKAIVGQFPEVQVIKIEDDRFIGDRETLRHFCEIYKKEIGLPLFITGLQPPMVDEEKIGLLVDAGLKRVRMGIQTGSMHTMHQVYRRPVKREQILKATQILHRHVGRIDPPLYDFIFDNPWETEQDQVETLRLLLEIPRPYILHLFSLTLFPGTELYERAKGEGLLQDEYDQIYRKHWLEAEHSYINELFFLLQTQRAPHWLIELLLHKRMRRLGWAGLPRWIRKRFGMCQRLEARLQSLLPRNHETGPQGSTIV